MIDQKISLTLSIGNSRLHWGAWQDQQLIATWNTAHFPVVNQILNRQEITLYLQQQLTPILPIDNLPDLPHLTIASVVPEQTAIWQGYPDLWLISLADIPLAKMYSTLGIDRALAVYGAGCHFGFPVLVIDAGTALTFTAAIQDTFMGGAILPGFRSQFTALATHTATLPLINLPTKLPSRWGNHTEEAIASGIIYTTLAGIVDFITAWQQDFPDSKIVITGGDRILLLSYLEELFPLITQSVIETSHIIFWGMFYLMKARENIR